MNIAHYNLDLLPDDLKVQAHERKLTGPCFIGQGLTKSVGSDSYGAYITAIKQVGKKTIFGITHANTVMAGHWTEGSMDCSIDLNVARPTDWIVASGKWKSGEPKWWFCNENGKKFNGARCTYHWNGASAYRDPSF